MTSKKYLCGLFFIIAVFIFILFWGLSQSSRHGLSRIVIGEDGYTREFETWTWVFYDGADISYHDGLNNVNEVRFDGFLWQGAPGETTWRIVHTGNINVRIDGQSIFEVTDVQELTVDEVAVNWDNEWLHLEIDYHFDPSIRDLEDGHVEMGIYQSSFLGGWELLPTHRLYPTQPETSLAQREITIYNIMRFALWGMIIGSGLLLAILIWNSHIWRKRETWAVIVVVSVAFLVRYILLLDRAVSDEFFYLLAHGSDNYVLMARETLAGHSHIAGAVFAPGNITWMLILSSLFGPQLWGLYLINTILGAISVGLIIAAGQITFGWRVGLISGLVAALFPPLIFYHTTLQPASVVASITPLLALLGLYSLRSPKIRYMVSFGITLGIVALFRLTTSFMGLAFVLAILWSKYTNPDKYSWFRAFSTMAVVTIFFAIPIIPQYYLNVSVDKNCLIACNGPVTFNWGNNRDGNGGDYRGQAWRVASSRGGKWIEEAVDDIKDDPLRAFELTLHKLGMLWSNTDYGNNVQFYWQGIDASPMLRLFHQNGFWGTTTLLFFGFVGLGIALNRNDVYKQETVGFLLLSILLISGATIIFTVFGRMRAPLWPLLCIPSGVTIVTILERKVSKKLVAIILIVIAIIGLVDSFEQHLPRKRFFHGELPENTIEHVSDINGELQLLGFEPIETSYRAGGYLYVTLYWKAIAQPTQDYHVDILLTDSQAVYVNATQQQIGQISYPPVGTSHWNVGDILRESYWVKIPDDAPSIINVVVNSYGYMYERLTGLGVLTSQEMPILDDSIEDVEFFIGDSLHITGIQVPSSMTAGEMLDIGVRWEAIKPIYEDYVIFYHLFDADMNSVTQSDNKALSGDWTTSALIPGYPLGGIRNVETPFDLPEGEYVLYMGVYRYPSIERLPVFDGNNAPLPDNLINLGTISIGN